MRTSAAFVDDGDGEVALAELVQLGLELVDLVEEAEDDLYSGQVDC